MRHHIFWVAVLGILLAHLAGANEDNGLTPEDIAFEKRDLSYYGNNGIPSGIINLASESSFYSPYLFIVDKGERILSLWQQASSGYKKLAVYPADIGKNSSDKHYLGDHATPEGIYFFLEKYEAEILNYEKYGSRAFTTDYPNFFDRLENKTGSGIWLHAVPDTVSLRRGSRGCVVVRDKIVKQLHQYFKPNVTPIIIEEKVDFLTPLQHETEKGLVFTTLAEWLRTWQKKDLDKYMKFYSDRFYSNSKKLDKKGWRQYKDGLNQTYDSITVQISEPVIYRHGKEIVARFIQGYTSDKYQDFGEKTLYMIQEKDGYKIIGETWRQDQSSLALDELQRPKVSYFHCSKLGTC